jgi:hypothetical protein
MLMTSILMWQGPSMRRADGVSEVPVVVAVGGRSRATSSCVRCRRGRKTRGAEEGKQKETRTCQAEPRKKKPGLE